MLKYALVAAAVIGFTAPALACGYSTKTAGSSSMEVAQTDKATKPLPQTPKPQTATQ